MTTSSGRYDGGARFFHWLFVLLFLAQVPAGISMVVPAVSGDFENLPGVEQGTIDKLYIFHKGMGAVLLVVVLARLVWRLTHRPPPFVNMPPLEQKIAGRTHAFMYVLMVLAAVTGYVHVIGLGFPIELLNALGVPPLLPKIPGIAVASSFIHRFTSYVLTGVVGVHVAEVLRHQWVEKDGTFWRMWPPIGRGKDRAPSSTAPISEREGAAVGVGRQR